MYLGTNFMPPVIHPTNQIVNHTFSTTVVPHIHPTHLTTVNHHMYQHKHYCTESASCAEEVCSQQINCCPPPMPCGPCGPTAPGFGGVGPGFMPGGPGFAPGPFMGQDLIKEIYKGFLALVFSICVTI
ncbi:spore coat protein [Neobacillus pocheonensis]|uniref:Spore coat protein n=1 Tax=Neobacillus pocheonensis TaxID=363869 RepID=A0ABT0W8R9_9BACI|nr:spore coat protein [Neobacillus pocheonensis]